MPAAVAGIDIRRVVKGAAEIASQEYFEGEGLDYAITRQLFYQSGKNIEIFEFFDPYMEYFGEWLKQLFGESEGKDKKERFEILREIAEYQTRILNEAEKISNRIGEDNAEDT